MAEDTSRALGAKSNTTIMIGDKACQIRPLSIAELGELERDCLSRYKRQVLKTFSENIDLVENGTQLLNDKLEEVSKWDVSDLPPKMAHDPSKIIVENKLQLWLEGNMDLELEEDGKKLSKEQLKNRIQVMTALALDSGELHATDYEILTGHAPKKVNVGYVSWWITAAYDGMISMIYLCFRGNDVTREEVIQAIGDNPNLLVDASREIEKLSAPAVGNG